MLKVGRRVNASGRMEAGQFVVVVKAAAVMFGFEAPDVVLKSVGEEELEGDERERPPSSTMLRRAMMTSISHSWKRSTTSAQVSWKRFSFSIFLNTVPLISTN